MRLKALLFLMLVAGCSVNNTDVQSQLQKFLGNTFAGHFEILSSNYSFAIGDDVATIEARFSEEGLKQLLASVDSSELIRTEKGLQFERKMTEGSGYDFLLVHMSPPSTNVRIQYGHE